MEKPLLIYCYDAYCGWCYGFSSVMKKLADHYQEEFDIDVLSGGMILPENPVHISVTAQFILESYQRIEEMTGVKFGEDYLWHIKNPMESDWFPNSEKPAIALCVFKEFYPERAVEFAADLQFALHHEGRDLTDDEAYRHLLEKYSIQDELFYSRLASEEYKDKAKYEFSLVQQLQVRAYPALLLQTGELKFHLLSRGYTDFETLKDRIDTVMKEETN